MITDLKVTQNDELIYDISLGNDGDLETLNSFDTAIIYSMLGERRASSSEVPMAHLRRGWIGNEGTGFENGSKLWLYRQARKTRTTLNGIIDATREGLLWLVDDGFLLDVNVTAKFIAEGIQITVNLIRLDSTVDTKNVTLWNNTGAN